MSCSLYLRIVHAIEGHDDHFLQKKDRNKRLGLSSLYKIITTFMMISQGVVADFMDHYIKIGESTVIKVMFLW
jgi:hypothetical protein